MNEEAPKSEESGIEVDLDAKPEEAVTRERPKRESKAVPRSNSTDKRIGALQRSFDQRLADQEARFQRQLAEQREEFTRARPAAEAPGDDEVKHQAVIDALTVDLEAAQERGDSKAVAKLTREISQAEARFWSAKTAKHTGTPAAKAAAPPQPTQAGKKWTDANAEWWHDTTDDDHAAMRGMANNLHAKFISEGSDPNTPEHYEKIRKVIARRFPEEQTVSTVKRDADEESPREERRAASMQLPDRGAPTSRNVQRLTVQDVAVMRSVGLDPNSNKAVLEFLKQKNLIEAEA